MSYKEAVRKLLALLNGHKRENVTGRNRLWCIGKRKKSGAGFNTGGIQLNRINEDEKMVSFNKVIYSEWAINPIVIYCFSACDYDW